MSDQINHARRRFLGRAAMTLVATKLGMLGAKAHTAAAPRLGALAGIGSSTIHGGVKPWRSRLLKFSPKKKQE
jgi:hypothetical protein